MQIDWEKLKAVVLWLHQLLKPRTHNRVALLVVLAGIGILISPIWEPFLRAIVEQVSATKIDPPNSPIYGLALVIAGLLYHFGAMRIEYAEKGFDADTRRQRSEKTIEHDNRIAERVRNMFPENTKQRLVSNLLNRHAYSKNEGDALGDTIIFLDSAEAYFLDEDLRKCGKEFADTGADLLKFMGFKFFTYPKEQTTLPRSYAMQPNLNMDREGDGSAEQSRKYDALTEELEKLVSRMSDAYDELIKMFHRRLLT